jgi:hypothetical protein
MDVKEIVHNEALCDGSTRQMKAAPGFEDGDFVLVEAAQGGSVEKDIVGKWQSIDVGRWKLLGPGAPRSFGRQSEPQGRVCRVINVLRRESRPRSGSHRWLPRRPSNAGNLI